MITFMNFKMSSKFLLTKNPVLVKAIQLKGILLAIIFLTSYSEVVLGSRTLPCSEWPERLRNIKYISDDGNKLCKSIDSKPLSPNSLYDKSDEVEVENFQIMRNKPKGDVMRLEIFSNEILANFKLPLIDYEMLKLRNLIVPTWGILEVDPIHRWHLHWAVEGRGDLENNFPRGTYDYEIQLLDSHGLNNNPSHDSIFATFLLRPYNRKTQEYTLCNIYTFYLIVPSSCRLHSL